jgi:hypothetical protein
MMEITFPYVALHAKRSKVFKSGFPVQTQTPLDKAVHCGSVAGVLQINAARGLSPRNENRGGVGMKSTRLGMAVAVSLAVFAATDATAAESTLDYGYYKSRVEPIFLKKRPGHARCAMCHADANNALKLQKLSAESKGWNDEESRKNFAVVSALVTPGSPDKSHLLTYPLAPEAGGSVYHSGGRQFSSKNDPDWKTIAAWVNGAKLKTAADTSK